MGPARGAAPQGPAVIVVHDIVDLRSDTLTLPTPEMREAMARAEVGDDVWEEDPTVKRLEAIAAERMGKEAGLFVASGTMGNLVSVVSHTRAGQEVVLDLDSHIFNYEVAGSAVIGNVQMRPVATARGFLTPAQVREALRPPNIYARVAKPFFVFGCGSSLGVLVPLVPRSNDLVLQLLKRQCIVDFIRGKARF